MTYRDEPRRTSAALKSEMSPVAVRVQAASTITINRSACIVLSCFAVLHCLAVFAEPYRFSSQATSNQSAPHTAIVQGWLSPYIDMMYLRHGYYFFAPNPGPAHIVEVQFKVANNSNAAAENPTKLRFPDLARQSPRLLYHRYFMYSEFYNTTFTPLDLEKDPDLPKPLPPPLVRGQILYSSLIQSLEKYIQARYPERPFQLYRLEHELPSPQQYFVEHLNLDDRRLFIEMPESALAAQLSDSREFVPVSPSPPAPLP